MKLYFPFVSFIVANNRPDFVGRSTEIDIPEIDSREYEGGTNLFQHVHYRGDGSFWYVPRVNEVNVRKPRGVIPHYEGDQSKARTDDERHCFLLRRISESLFGVRPLDFDRVVRSHEHAIQSFGAHLTPPSPFLSIFNSGPRKPEIDHTPEIADKIKAYASQNMRVVDGQIIVRGHDPMIGIVHETFQGSNLKLIYEDGVLWGGYSKAQVNFTLTELDEAKAFLEQMWKASQSSVWKVGRYPPGADQANQYLDLPTTESPYERTICAMAASADYGPHYQLPRDTGYAVAKMRSRLGTPPEARDDLFHETLADELASNPYGTTDTQSMIQWSLERWDQRPVSLSIPFVPR